LSQEPPKNNTDDSMAADDVESAGAPPVAEVRKKASTDEDASLVLEGTDSEEEEEEEVASSANEDRPEGASTAFAVAAAAAAAAASSRSPSPTRRRHRRRRQRTHSLEEGERHVQSSYKKIKREAERKYGVDSLGRRNLPVPREATPVPNVYRRGPALPPGSAASAPPAFVTTTTTRSRGVGVYEGIVFRGSGRSNNNNNNGGAADPRLGYEGLSFGGGSRGHGRASSSLKPPPPPSAAAVSDRGLGYSGVAFRRPNDGGPADPRFHVFELDETPVPGVTVRKAATEPMTFARGGVGGRATQSSSNHQQRARSTTAAARRLSFDHRRRPVSRRNLQSPLRDDDDDDYDDQGHNPFEHEEATIHQSAKKTKASWDDVLDRDFDAFPPRDEGSVWARLGRALGPAMRSVAVAAAHGLAFVWWWVTMAVLAEHVVNNFIAPDA
jgi:hypothetical protein